MPNITLDVAGSYAAQVIGAAVVALVLFGFQRRYRTSYLHHWTLGWTALALYQVGTLGSLLLSVALKLPSSNPGRLTVTILTSIAGYAVIAWFVFGVYELIRRRPVRLLDAKRILLTVVALGLLTSLIGIDETLLSPARYLSRVGLRSLIGACLFFASGVALWRVRLRRPGIGVTLLATTFALYGLEQLHYATLAVLWSSTGHLIGYITELGLLDFVLQSILALGMIACLLEEEREAAELASVEIAHLAYHDALTGLPNRPLFMDRLIVAISQSHRNNQKLAVLFIDLDRFKNINDSLGHSVGDQLLKSVADRVTRCVREGDTVARFGGDEFTLLLPTINDVEEAAKFAEKVIDTLKIPFTIADRELFVSGSIGISLYPGDGADAETLVRNADTAMYRAKDSGRDNYQLYAPAMNARALERLALENMLRKAISQDELVLHYQPLVDAHRSNVVGLEALLRWQHPELGLLSPAHFISVAEVSGLIIPIGEWVLRTACRQIRTWQKRFPQPLYIAVNLSARQFQQPDLLQMIRRTIEDTGIQPQSLELEITESNAMQNAENSIYTLRELKSIGVRIAMDDFGTGYSSLNYLKRFPIDTLKLDQSFVRDVTTDASDAAIVSAVISMAHSLDLDVVAEGVETADQLEFLQKQRCDRIQGYFFSAPLPADELERLLTTVSATAV